MPGFSRYAQRELLDHLMKVGAFAQPTNIYVALFNAGPTECTGTGYARVLCNAWDAATETQKVATVTPGAEQSITEYEFTGADTTPFPVAGTYVFEFEITSPSGRKRRCRPKEVYAYAQGTGGRK